MNDEYFVWAVVIAVVVFALVFSWNSREHFDQKCWGSEQTMSATTGYPQQKPYDGESFIKYRDYVLDKTSTVGRINFNIETAKSYCSTVNCTGILVVPIAGGPGAGGTDYIPITNALVQTPLDLPVGSIPPPKIILPVACQSSTTSTLSSVSGVPPTCPGGSVLSSKPEHAGKCASGRSTGIIVSTAICPANTVFNASKTLCMPSSSITTPTTTPSSATNDYAGNKAVEEAQAKYKAEADKRAKDLVDAADWLAKNKTLSPAEFTKAWEKKYGSVDSTVTEAEWLKWVTGTTTTTDKGTDSKNRAIDAVGAAAKDATSTLGSVSGMSGMNGKWNQGPKGSVGDSDKWATPGDAYILKSSMVPCTCTTHSMGCERHSGSKQESFAPGDLDGNFQYRIQPQSGLMRPFSQAFLSQGEPTGFLNTFSAFA